MPPRSTCTIPCRLAVAPCRLSGAALCFAAGDPNDPERRADTGRGFRSMADGQASLAAVPLSLCPSVLPPPSSHRAQDQPIYRWDRPQPAQVKLDLRAEQVTRQATGARYARQITHAGQMEPMSGRGTGPERVPRRRIGHGSCQN